MKVLEKGRAQRGWSLKQTCSGKGNGGGGCGAKLLVEESDLYETQSHALHETDYYTTYTCPCCGVLSDVPDSLVPSTLQRSLPYKSPRNAKKEWEESHPE